jgi:hypothetical protein
MTGVGASLRSVSFSPSACGFGCLGTDDTGPRHGGFFSPHARRPERVDVVGPHRKLDLLRHVAGQRETGHAHAPPVLKAPFEEGFE